jgi:hypothetical protein
METEALHIVWKLMPANAFNVAGFEIVTVFWVVAPLAFCRPSSVKMLQDATTQKTVLCVYIFRLEN